MAHGRLAGREHEIFEHLIKRLGQPNRVFRFDDLPESTPSPILVLEFAPPSEEYDWVYATIGASNKAIFYPVDPDLPTGSDHRIELEILSNSQNHEIVDSLLALALYPFVLHTLMGPGHTIHGSDEGIVNRSPLTDILFYLMADPDVPDYSPVIHHTDGSHTLILDVVPVYPSERRCVTEDGIEKLERLFADNQIDTADYWRAPVI